MRQRTTLVAFIAMFLVGSFSFLKAEEPLDSMPDTSGALFRFQSIDKFLKNANDMFGAIGGMAVVAGAQMEQGILGEMFELGPSHAGLDRSQPAFALIFPIDRGIPVAWFVKPKDEEALKKAVARAGADTKLEASDAAAGFTKLTGGRRVAYFAKRGGYTVYTVNEAIVKLFAESKGSLGKALPAAAIDEMKAGDAAVVVNSKHLVGKFKREIESGKAELMNVIDALPEEQLGPTAEATKKLYKEFANQAFHAVMDSEWVVGRANLSAGGAQLSGVFGFKADSKTEKAISGLTISPMDNFELLPAAASVYFGVQMDYGGKAGDWLKALMGPGIGDEKAMKEAFDIIAKAKVTSMAGSFSFPSDDSTGMKSTVFEQAKDVSLLRKGWAKYMSAIGSIETPMYKQTMTLKQNAEKYKKYSIDVVETKIDTSAAPPEVQGLLDGIYKKMFGGNSLQSRLTSVENLLIQVTGNDAKLIQKTIDRFDTGEGVIGLEKAYSKTRDKLHEESAFIMLLDLPKLMTESINLIKDVPPFNALLQNAPFDFNTKHPSSFSGVSVSRAKKALQVRIFVPTEQPKVFMQMFAPSL